MITNMTDTLTLSNIKARLKAPSPPIFVTIRKILITVGGIGSAVVLATVGLPITLPAIVTTIAGYMIVAGAVGTGLTSLTAANPPALESSNNSVVSQSK
jgi:hypothetical protein